MELAAEDIFEDELIVSPDLQPLVDRLREQGHGRQSILAQISSGAGSEIGSLPATRMRPSVVLRRPARQTRFI